MQKNNTAPTLTEKTVIIIQNKALNTATVRQMVVTLGYKPTLFSELSLALEHLTTTNQQIDLILIDKVLPNNTQALLIQNIRHEQKYEKTPVFSINNHLTRTDLMKLFAAGVNEIVNDPIDERSFAATLKRYLDPHAQSSNLEIATAINHPVQLDIDADTFFDIETTLQNYKDNRETVHMLVDMFYTSLPIHKNNINTALQNKDSAALSAEAHKIKGGVSIIIMPQLREATVLLQRAIGEFTYNDQVVVFAEELLTEIDRAERRLPEFMSSLAKK